MSMPQDHISHRSATGDDDERSAASRRTLLMGFAGGTLGATGIIAGRSILDHAEPSVEQTDGLVLKAGEIQKQASRNVEIRVFGGGNAEQVDYHNNVLEVWMPNLPQQSAAEASYQNTGKTSNNQFTQTDKTLKMYDQHSNVELAVLDPEYLEKLVRDKLITPFLTVTNKSLLRSGCHSRLVDRCIVKGKLYAIPIHADTPMIVANSALLDREQDTLLQLESERNAADFWCSVFAMSRHKDGDKYPRLRLESGDYEGFTACLVELICAFDGNLRDDPAMRNSENRDALKRLRREIRRWGIEYAFEPPDRKSDGEESGVEALAKNEKAHFARLWPASRKAFSEIENQKHYKWIPIPGGTLGGQVIVLSRGTGNRELCEALAWHLGGPVSQIQLLYRGNYVPTLTYLHRDQQAQDAFCGGDDTCLGSAMSSGATRPKIYKYDDWSQAFRRSVRNFLMRDDEDFQKITEALSVFVHS